ncbi:MAG: glycosyl hydrolase family 28-related protein [Methylocella sp.]
MRTSTCLFGLYTGRIKRRQFRLLRWHGVVGGAALVWGLGAAAAVAAPVIFNQPFTANPGDVISVTGSSLTTTPKVYIQGGRQSAATLVPAMEAADNVVVVQIPATLAFDVYKLWVVNSKGTSAPVYLNAPRAMSFDAPRAVHYDATRAINVDNAATPAVEIAAGDQFRIFGRNLYVNSAADAVTLIDAQTGTSLAATVSGAKDANSLTAIAPSGIVAGRTYNVTVSNGYGSAQADQAIIGRSGGGSDYFKLGVTWGRDFITQNGAAYNAAKPGVNEQYHHIYNVMTDPVLKLHAVGNGVADDTAAINAAIAAAAKSGGGIAYLPAGTYRLASRSGAQTGIALQAGVVLQGQSDSTTKIVYGPTSSQPSSYNFNAVTFNGNVSGIADLSFQSADAQGLNITPLVNQWLTPYSELFAQRVNWNLNASAAAVTLIGCNKVAIENSTFSTLANAPKTGGPFYFANSTNVTVQNNTLAFGFIGSASFSNIDNIIVEGNHFTRYSSPTWIGLGRQMSFNFIRNGVVQNNIFDVSGATLPFQNADGETILSEGGSLSPEVDSGAVTAATSATIADGSRCATCAWNLFPNSYVVVVSGKGAGQWRHIVGLSGNTFTIDKPWDVIPAAGDHFATGAPSYENVMIRNNTMQNNPAGIVLFGPVMFLNVAIANNQLTDNGGIILAPYQVNQARWNTTPPVAYLDATYRNIEIKNNVLKNTKGQWPSSINTEFFSISPNQFWGVSADGVEVRNNQLTAHAAINPNNYLYTGNNSKEGYENEALNQQVGNGAFVYTGPSPIVGTVFQGNSCVNCPVQYELSYGALATVIWNATGTSNVASTFLLDDVFANWSPATAGPHSTGTITNNPAAPAGVTVIK